MYLEFHGLSEAPFSLTPDTGFFFDRGSHREALNVLLVAIAGGEGFIKITGEVGLGKSLLCRTLLNALDARYVTAYLPNPHLSPASMRLVIAAELGVTAPRRASQELLLRLIQRRLIEIAGNGQHAVLCLDEVQQMPDQTLEAVRLLTNLETEKTKLLQVVLFAQPELDRRLAAHDKRQILQRISFSYRLRPMTRAEVCDYVAHRLTVAGRHGASPFRPGALRLLARASHGVPRRVNLLAHKALMAAYGEGRTWVDRSHVRAAVRDTDATAGDHRWRPTRRSRFGYPTLLLLICLMWAVWYSRIWR